MSVFARTQGGNDRGKVDGMPAKGGGQQREKAGGGKKRAGRGIVIIGAQDGRAGNVLRCHGDDKQRQGNADQTGQCEFRHDEFDRRHDGAAKTAERIFREIYADHHDNDKGQQGRRHGKQAVDPPDHQPGNHNRQAKKRIERNRFDRCQTQAQQHTGQHGIGKRGGNGGNRTAQRLPDAADDDQDRANDKCPDGHGKTAVNRAGCCQQGRTGGGPCDADRHAGTQ